MTFALCVILLGAGGETIALDAGQPAPFAGLLLPEAEIHSLLKAERDLTVCGMRLRVLERENDALEELLRDAAHRARPWYDHPQVRFVAGFVVGSAATLAILATTAKVIANE